MKGDLTAYMRSMLLAVALVSSVAFAGLPKRLAMPVGQTTTLSMPAPVSKVTVDDPSKLEVQRNGRHVKLIGRGTGTTEVTVRTADGETHLTVYVAADKYGMP
ncbi:MAG: hypothetical protein DI536_31500 [Archangium gephyra]|uniref:Pilus formation protein N-terminal domain-containing protein n=1 Tax=Archangium gephyra TaxID=48 RepID=A0A2W5SW99_9BACT|nr:MAG: hypothetical protein DI536_31500 [Archangium gephyra]